MYGQAVIPDDWEGDYCCYAVCWPNSPQWLAVLRGILTEPGQGRFWDRNTGIITEAQSVIRETFDNNLHLEALAMACTSANLNQLATALEHIAIALAQNGQCCDTRGSGGSGQTSQPISTTLEGDPETDPPPEGYDSWEDFYQDKCAKAAYLINQMQQDLAETALTNFETVLSPSLLASVIAIVITTPIPFDDIIAIAVLLLAVAAEVVITSALSYINDNEEGLRCELFNGTSPSDSKARFMALFNSLVDNGTSDPIENYTIKGIVNYFLSADSLQRLYTKDTTRTYAASDCSMCEVCDPVVFHFDEDEEGFTFFSDYGATGSWVSGELSTTLPAISPPSNGSGGWEYILPVNRVIVAGDGISAVFATEGTIDTYAYLQAFDADDENITYQQLHLTGTTSGTLGIDLDAFTGQTIKKFKVYCDTTTVSGVVTFDDVTYLLCGEEV